MSALKVVENSLTFSIHSPPLAISVTYISFIVYQSLNQRIIQSVSQSINHYSPRVNSTNLTMTRKRSAHTILVMQDSEAVRTLNIAQ